MQSKIVFRRLAMLGAILAVGGYILSGCNAGSGTSFKRNPIDVITDGESRVEIYDFANFRPFLEQDNDTVYVVNFWATWCAPCVKELPYFEKIREKYRDRPLKVLLVSLDFPDKAKTGLIPYINKKNLGSEVVLLDDPDANSWIPAVDPEWSGAIPATVIYSGEERSFYEQSFTYEELETEVTKFLH